MKRGKMGQCSSDTPKGSAKTLSQLTTPQPWSISIVTHTRSTLDKQKTQFKSQISFCVVLDPISPRLSFNKLFHLFIVFQRKRRMVVICNQLRSPQWTNAELIYKNVESLEHKRDWDLSPGLFHVIANVWKSFRMVAGWCYKNLESAPQQQRTLSL